MHNQQPKQKYSDSPLFRGSCAVVTGNAFDYVTYRNTLLFHVILISFPHKISNLMLSFSRKDPCATIAFKLPT
jgi:hypothetical protein